MRRAPLLLFLLAGLLLMIGNCQKEKPKTEEELYTMAQEALNKGNSQDALKYYQQILKEYPQSSNNYKAQFMIGYVYSEQLNDTLKAKEAYRKVIEQYPNCDLVESARWMMENAGKKSLDFIFSKGDSAGAKGKRGPKK